MPVDFEEATWPIATLRIRGSLTASEEDFFTQTSVDLPLRQQRYVAIIDLLDAATPTTRFMRGQAAAQRKREEELRAYCVGVAFIIRSAMIRGALRAILHLQGLPSPYIVVATVEDARRWAETMLATDRESM